MKAKILIEQHRVIQPGKYVAHVVVYEVSKSKKFPQGIKAKYLLQDIEQGFPRLLIDNHEPYGFHMHTRLPEDKKHREKLSVQDHQRALDIFFNEVERIRKNEE